MKIDIPSHIQDLKSYNPGKDIADYQAEFGFSSTAILWNNENNLGVPPKAKEEIEKAFSQLNVYPDPLSRNLRTALATLNGVNTNQISVENGSESILANIFKAFASPGDTLLTSEGTFVAVYIWAKLANLKCHKTPLNSVYGFDLEAILNDINHSTKIIYLSNPNNPTGTMIPEKDLRNFLARVPENIVVIVDEAYFEYAQNLSSDYPDTSRWNLPNLITLRTFSKAYGLAGVRLGYSIASEEITEVLNKVRMTFAPSLLTQASGLGALKDDNFLKQTIYLNNQALGYFYKAFEELNINYIPSYGNFAMLTLESEEAAQNLSMFLLKNGVFVRHLKAFGLPHCIRVSTGLNHENEHFITCLNEFQKIKSIPQPLAE